MPHKFRDLIVWQQSMGLITEVYALTRTFPQHELYGLTSQLRRAAISSALNIAEGAGNNSSAEFKRFLGIALRSAYETMTALEIAARLGYCTASQIEPLLAELDTIAAKLVRLAEKLESAPAARTVRESPTEYRTDALTVDTFDIDDLNAE